MTGSFALDDQYRAAHAVATFNQLLWLDNVWTGYLDQASAIPQPDVHVLARLNADMRKLLIEASQAVVWLGQTIPQYQQAIDDGFAKVLSEPTLDASEARKLNSFVRRKGGFSTLAGKNTTVVARLLVAEDKALNAKIAKITAGKFTPGDIAHSLICGLLLAAVAGAIFIKSYPTAATAAAAYIKQGCLAPLIT